MMRKLILISSLILLVTGCTEWEPKPFEPSPAHIDTEQQPATTEIPELVQAAPVLPEPEPAADLERYTVVVNEVPVKELLFALARDARINVDIHPDIEGLITINAVDQTLPQILDRISGQVNLRYEQIGDNLIVQPDVPFLRTYKIDYVNFSRDTSSTNTVKTQITTTSSGDIEGGGGSGGGNNSTTDVSSISTHHFWDTLVANISAILQENITIGAGGSIAITDSVIPSPESGMLTVRATERQHEEIQEFIDQVMVSAKRQVLIQVTIVEIDLSDQYQAGIDWSFLNRYAGIDVISTTLTGVPLGTLSSFVLDYVDDGLADEDKLKITVRLLDEFGDVKVMSSPQMMVLNNQTAMLKVVENVVYFDVEVDPGVANSQGAGEPAVNTDAQTVPVGITMAVTPQISASDEITLNIRPTISRVTEFVEDPNPELANAGTSNLVPQIGVREIESMLRLTNGQIGVLGGLMQDETHDQDNDIPGFSKLPGVGRAFETRTKKYFKTELVIFLRPIIIRNPSLDGDLQLYKSFLEQQPASSSPEVNSL